jgi:hypothetical protein
MPLLAVIALLATSPAYAGGDTLNLRTAGNSFRFSNISLKKVKSSSARSGYMFRFFANVTNIGKSEFTQMGSAVSSVACMAGTVRDDQGRKFDLSCDIPPLLPTETSKRVQIAWSSAMADSRTAQLCLGWMNCTSQLTPR